MLLVAVRFECHFILVIRNISKVILILMKAVEFFKIFDVFEVLAWLSHSLTNKISSTVVPYQGLLSVTNHFLKLPLLFRISISKSCQQSSMTQWAPWCRAHSTTRAQAWDWSLVSQDREVYTGCKQFDELVRKRHKTKNCDPVFANTPQLVCSAKTLVEQKFKHT